MVFYAAEHHPPYIPYIIPATADCCQGYFLWFQYQDSTLERQSCFAVSAFRSFVSKVIPRLKAARLIFCADPVLANPKIGFLAYRVRRALLPVEDAWGGASQDWESFPLN